MAQGKKSFILYSDMRGSFDKLPDELAGKLIKHIFAYVNDENPISEDYTINAIFDQLEKTLKRDLQKWEAQLEQRSEAGRISAEKRRLAKLEAERIANETQRKATTVEIRSNETLRNSTDNCNMLSVNCNMENVSINIDNSLMSEIEISDVPQNELEYFNIANSFYLLFKRNSEEVLKVKWGHLSKTKYKNCITPIRLLLTNDKRTVEELQAVYKLLQTDSFWMGNIQTTDKLREQFDKLITKTSNVVLNNQKPKTDEQQHNERVQEAGLAIWKQAMGLD